MRKMVFGRKFSRGKKGREALIRSLVKAVILNEKITTTKARAKAVVGQVDKLVTLARQKTVSSRRRVLAFLGNDRLAADRLLAKVSSFGQEKGGYTKFIRLLPRKGDNAPMVRVEWNQEIKPVKAKEKNENLSTNKKRN